MLRKILVISLLMICVTSYAETKTAIFAGGCFWCMEHDFEKLPGVVHVESGYDGGRISEPSYEEVASGKTHYVESVKVTYDPAKVSYPTLLHFFWRHVDPTQENGQFCDHGPQYRTVIFYLNDEQKEQAQDSLKNIKTKFKHVYTEILPTTKFYPAEDYHQNYAEKNPIRYKFYRWNCDRDQQISRVWHEKK